eukprot:TRINITY_DN14182_c0_g2_i1.p1 TRINITY_DN14182_c0_g2~~TRINITY_DN14182_c0_g2_i1.p1  ORF type:complete len:709 (-),score=91.04 TRINITY_DN14182_c0_g2_i1:73-2199(-)
MAYSYPNALRSDCKEANGFGREMPDPYRWLEDNESAETKEWVRQQNEVTDGMLKNVPWRSKVRESMTEQFNYERRGAPYYKGGKWYYARNTGLQNQDVLYVKDDIHDTAQEAKVFCDPNTLAEDGTSALGPSDWTKSGSYWAYSVKKKGSDWQIVHVRDCKSGKDLDDKVEWVKFSGISWTHDEKGFFYSRFPSPTAMDGGMTDAAGTETQSNENAMLYYHVLGTPQSEDRLIYFDAASPKNMYGAEVSEDGNFCVITVREGCKAEKLLWYIDLRGKDPSTLGPNDVVKLVDEWAWDYEFIDNDGTVFFLKTTEQAPRRKLVSIDLQTKAFTDVIPEHPKDPLQWCSTGAGGVLYCCYMVDVQDVVFRSTLSDPNNMTKVPLAEGGAVVGFECSSQTTDVFVQMTSFTYPTRIYHYNASTDGEPTLFYEAVVKGHDSSQFVTEQVFFDSKDGKRIPMFLVYKKGMERNGNNVTLLYAYGGFRISLRPSFSPLRLTFLNHFNGVFALANIRGGAEYGEDWWKGGSCFTKQNCFDDFQAAAKWLHDTNVTKPEKLTIMGGSNGGLLVAACANQAPELYGCVICQVGVLDITRFHKFTIGHAWRSDFGDPDKEEDFNYLIKYSPLHNIDGSKKYPSIMCLTGDHDDRVVPLHTFKYMAELQHACGSQSNPFLARIEVNVGHGAGKPTSKIIEEAADLYSFLTYRCGGEWHD